MREQNPIPEHSGAFPEDAFINRELSQLSFFKRVLDLAARESTPLLERLRFITITSTILDEFFEIRVAGLKERLRLGVDRPGPDGWSARDLLAQINREVTEITQRQYDLLENDIWPKLSQRGVAIVKREEWTKAQVAWIQKYFHDHVAPVLTPVSPDPSHPFPKVPNKSLNILLCLEGEDAFGRAGEYTVLPVPRCLPRVIELPVSKRKQRDRAEFVLLSSLIYANAAEIFPGLTVKSINAFRLTRHADLSVDEDEVEDLLDALKGELTGRRHGGEGVRLEVADTCPKDQVTFLCEQFGLTASDVYRVPGPVNLHRLATVVQLVDRPDLKFPAFTPAVVSASNLFETLQRRDVLLHHPFQSFSPVVELIKAAAKDPDVLAIKQTLYRTGSESPFVAALAEAARAGKEVLGVIELRARFDEAANIDIAKRLQNAGAHVVYGVVGYKTHAKMLLIVRKEAGGIRRYVHLGTGNYHTGTSRAYTDFSLLTSDERLGEDVHEVFMRLTCLGARPQLNALVSAPFALHKMIQERLDVESQEARAGRPARVIIKVNSVSDPAMIEALYRASQAGVKIEMIVRGICCLKAGVPGLSDNITVRSVLGRFLEHSRVYYFHSAGEERLYLASADLMQRNLYRRVEVAFPVTHPPLKARVLREGLLSYLDDTEGAWEMTPTGTYSRVKDRLAESASPFEAQTALLSARAEG